MYYLRGLNVFAVYLEIRVDFGPQIKDDLRLILKEHQLRKLA
jgi:hypothetical protein